MIHIELTVDDLDYDMLIDRFFPAIVEKLQQNNNSAAMLISNGMPASMVKRIISQMPQEKKDQLATDLINQFSNKIALGAEKTALQNGFQVSVCHLEAHSDI